MVIILIVYVVLIWNQALALDRKDVESFLSYLNSNKFCSESFIKTFKNTPFEELSRTLYLDSCNGSLTAPPKNDYGKYLYAKKLYREDPEKALPLLREAFKKGIQEEEIILLLGKNWKKLLTPEAVREKIKRLIYWKNFDEALFYLDFIKGSPYFYYLSGLLEIKRGNKALAKELLKESKIPESFLSLIYIEKELPGKVYYFKKLLSSTAPKWEKKKAAVYLFDKLLYNDLGLFRKELPLLKEIDGKLYRKFKVRYLIYTGKEREALRELEKLSGSQLEAWKIALKRKLGEKAEIKQNRVNFYTLLLGRETEIVKIGKPADYLKDPGLKLLLESGKCYTLTLIEEKTPQMALALNLCGDYKQAIKLASKLRKSIDRNPFLLKVLYPAPPAFKGDIFALSIARQESLFNHRAYSRSGAIGLMQIMPKTGSYIAKKLSKKDFKVSNLFDPEINTLFGSYYIHSLIKRFKLFPLAAAAYNGGPSRVEKALKLYGKIKRPEDLILFNDAYIPFKETRDYVRKTYVNLYYYSLLYGKGNEWKIFSEH